MISGKPFFADVLDAEVGKIISAKMWAAILKNCDAVDALLEVLEKHTPIEVTKRLLESKIATPNDEIVMYLVHGLAAHGSHAVPAIRRLINNKEFEGLLELEARGAGQSTTLRKELERQE